VIDTTAASTARMLRTRGAPVEYWFLKVNGTGLAFLADFIVRRARPAAEIRLSYWVRGAGRVHHDVRESWEIDGSTVRIGDGVFTDTATSGVSGDVRWDLRYRLGPRWLDPGGLGAKLLAFDTQIVLSPGARVSGEVIVGGEKFAFDDAPAVACHYWSRRLPDRWVWLSANTRDLDVEALFSRTRVGRLPWPRLSVAYVYVADATSTRYVISPLNGIARATGTADEIRVRTWSPRGSIAVRVSRNGAANNDIGEGITQTLLADASVDGHELRGCVGLETRGWS